MLMTFADILTTGARCMQHWTSVSVLHSVFRATMMLPIFCNKRWTQDGSLPFQLVPFSVSSMVQMQF